MWLFVGFLIMGMLSGWIFRLLAGLFEAIVIFPLFGLRKGGFERSLETQPKRFITAIIIKNVIIGLAHSVMVLTITARFVNEYGGNQWLYFVMGTIWSLYILNDNNKAFVGVFFWTSTVNFVLMWFGFGFISLIGVGLLTLFISLAFYYGRIGMFQEAYGGSGVDVEEQTQ